MKKIIKSFKSKENKYIFTEGINYFETGKISIWGAGDKNTLELLKKIKIHGKWLNLAAGDGRYNLNLLEKADFIVASDIDEGALSKLWHNTPKKFKGKLNIKVFDITKKFPFKNNSFDGVFCAGTLHLFPIKIFKKIFSEIDRVLKPNARVIIDFATNIRRISPDGKFITFGNEPRYSINEAKSLLRNTFKDYKIQMYESIVPEEDFTEANPSYKFSCKFILLVADKK